MKYREIDIEYFWCHGELKGFIVNYCGDEVVFATIDEAKQFIDDVICSLPFC